jgi:CMP-N,N'-diacetyllegionaminic acid synthase
MQPKIICTICARGGSKGVPGKNIALIGGHPLISYSIRQAQASNLFLIVAVSSDDQDILRAGSEAGATLLVSRPSELASDTAGKLPAIQHCLQEDETALGSKVDVIVDLDVTSPLRTSEDIVGAVNLLLTTDADNIITGSKSRRSPYFNMVEIGENGYARLSKNIAEKITGRQSAPLSFDMNASIYVWHRKTLVDAKSVILAKTRLFEMPEERSIDIDTALDFEIVNYLLNKASRYD